MSYGAGGSGSGSGSGSSAPKLALNGKYELKHITHRKEHIFGDYAQRTFHVYKFRDPVPALEGGGGKGKAPAAEVVETRKKSERKMRADEVSLLVKDQGRSKEWEGNKDQAGVGTSLGGNAAESTYVLLRVRERAPDEAAGADRGGEIMEILPVEDQYSFRPKITYKTLTLEEAEEQERKLRTGEERFDRINRKKAAAAPEDGEEAAAAAAAELDFDVWGARTADLGGKEGEDMEPEEGRDGLDVEEDDDGFDDDDDDAGEEDDDRARGARSTAIGSRGVVLDEADQLEMEMEEEEAGDGDDTYGRVSTRGLKNDEGSFWTHFKGEKGEDLWKEAKKDELKAKRERQKKLGSDDEDDDDDDESELGDEGAQVLHEVSTGLTQFKVERLGPEEGAATAGAAEGGESSAAGAKRKAPEEAAPEAAKRSKKLVTEKDIVDVINEAGQIQIKTLIGQFKALIGKGEEARREFMAKVQKIAKSEKVEEGGKSVTYVVLKPETIDKYGLKPRE